MDRVHDEGPISNNTLIEKISEQYAIPLAERASLINKK